MNFKSVYKKRLESMQLKRIRISVVNFTIYRFCKNLGRALLMCVVIIIKIKSREIAHVNLCTVLSSAPRTNVPHV